MATLDWSQCLAVEAFPESVAGHGFSGIPGRRVVFDNLEVGASINEIMDLLRRPMFILFDNGLPLRCDTPSRATSLLKPLNADGTSLLTANG